MRHGGGREEVRDDGRTGAAVARVGGVVKHGAARDDLIDRLVENVHFVDVGEEHHLQHLPPRSQISLRTAKIAMLREYPIEELQVRGHRLARVLVDLLADDVPFPIAAGQRGEPRDAKKWHRTAGS